MLNLEIPGVVKVWDTICSHITGVQHLARQAGVIQTWAKSLLTHIYYAGMVWADLHLVLLRCFIDYYLIAPLTPEALITRMLSSNQQWFTPTLWGSWWLWNPQLHLQERRPWSWSGWSLAAQICAVTCVFAPLSAGRDSSPQWKKAFLLRNYYQS